MKRSHASTILTLTTTLLLAGCSEPLPPQPVEVIRPVKSFLIEGSAIVGEYKLDPQAWVIDETAMTVKPRSIKVGRLLGEQIEVLEGLQAGDRIVTAGTPFLVEGMKVRLMPELEQAMQRSDDLKYQ